MREAIISSFYSEWPHPAYRGDWKDRDVYSALKCLLKIAEAACNGPATAKLRRKQYAHSLHEFWEITLYGDVAPAFTISSRGIGFSPLYEDS